MNTLGFAGIQKSGEKKACSFTILLLGSVFAAALVLAPVSVVPVRARPLALAAEEAGRAGAGAVGGVAEGVVLAVAHVPAVLAVGVHRTGPVAVVTGVTRLAHARPRPRVTPGGRITKLDKK